MSNEIGRINQVLPRIGPSYAFKTQAIQRWMRSVLDRMKHYKRMYYTLLKEAITLLELAVWKANLVKIGEDNGYSIEEKQRGKRARIDVDAARQAARVTCGADIIIKNVMPFLNDNDVFSSFLNRDDDEDAYDDEYDE